MDEAKVERYLGIIGKQTFVTYYELLADFDLPDCQGRSENVPVRRSKSVPLNLHLVSETMVGSSLELIPLNGGRSTGPGCCQSQGWRESRPICSV